ASRPMSGRNTTSLPLPRNAPRTKAANVRLSYPGSNRFKWAPPAKRFRTVVSGGIGYRRILLRDRAGEAETRSSSSCQAPSPGSSPLPHAEGRRGMTEKRLNPITDENLEEKIDEAFTETAKWMERLANATDPAHAAYLRSQFDIANEYLNFLLSGDATK